MASAIFGGSSTAISFVLVATYFLCALALIRSLNRYLGISFLGSCAAAAAYLLNGFALANLSSAIGQPYFLAPVLLFTLLRIAERATLSRIAQAGLVQAGMLAITIFPPMALATFACYCLAITATFGRNPSFRQGLRAGARQIAALPIGLGLTAFLYLPIFEAQLSYAPIAFFYNHRAEYHFAMESLLSFFDPKNFPIRAGVVAFLVAGCGIAKRGERALTAIAMISTCLVIVTLGQMFSIPLLNYIGRLPLVQFTRPDYWPALAGLPLAVLVALGIDNRGKGGEIGFACAGAIVAASFALALSKTQAGASLPQPVWVFLAISFTCCFGLVYLLLRLRSWRLVAVTLSVGILGEGMYYMNTLRPRRSAHGTALPRSIQTVKDRLTQPFSGRVLNIGRSGLLPDWGSATQIPQAGAMGLVIVSPYLKFFDEHIGRGLFETLDNDSAFRFSGASLSAADIRFVIVDKQSVPAVERLDRLSLKRFSEDPVRIVFEAERSLPRAYLVAAIKENDQLPTDLEMGHVAFTSDRSFLAMAKAAGIPELPGGASSPQSVEIQTYWHADVRIRTNSATPAVLVLSDSWHPNWRARIDGAETTVGLVNMAFRGVVIPPGSHHIEFRYRPKTLTFGLWISTLTFMTLGALAVRERFSAPVSMPPSSDQEPQQNTA